MAMARQARSGRPKCRKDAARPTASITRASSSAVDVKPVDSGTPVRADTASATTRPWAAPATAVKEMTEKAGFTGHAPVARRAQGRRHAGPLWWTLVWLRP